MEGYELINSRRLNNTKLSLLNTYIPRYLGLETENNALHFSIIDNEELSVLIPIGYAADEPKEKKRKEIEAINNQSLVF